MSVQLTSAMPPLFQRAAAATSGSWLPRSPSFANELFWKLAPEPGAPIPVPGKRPPAAPQASITGAEPGARHGEK